MAFWNMLRLSAGAAEELIGLPGGSSVGCSVLRLNALAIQQHCVDQLQAQQYASFAIFIVFFLQRLRAPGNIEQHKADGH